MLRTWKKHYNRSVWPAVQEISPVSDKFAPGINRWLALAVQDHPKCELPFCNQLTLTVA